MTFYAAVVEALVADGTDAPQSAAVTATCCCVKTAARMLRCVSATVRVGCWNFVSNVHFLYTLTTTQASTIYLIMCLAWTGLFTLISLFLVSRFNFLFVPCGGLSWLPVSFLLHVKYTLSYRIYLVPCIFQYSLFYSYYYITYMSLKYFHHLVTVRCIS